MEHIQKLWQCAVTHPVRPLGDISDFVQETLPRSISQLEALDEASRNTAVAELQNEISRLFSQLNQHDIEEIELSDCIKVATLDCKMCAMALWHNKVPELPANLLLILQSLCAINSDPLILTYEDIILNNPTGDLRTFFPKDSIIGQHESFFYRSHQAIEDLIIPVVTMIKNALTLRSASELKLIRIEAHLEKANSFNLMLREQLDKKSFEIFRKYLDSLKELKLQGPSGAFSGSYPLIDLLWRGDDILLENKNRYLSNNMYFPGFQRKEIQQLIDSPAISVKLLAQSETERFSELYEIIKNQLTKFRSAHLASVKKHLPEVYSGKERGTAGDIVIGDTGSYLKKSLGSTNEDKLG